MTSCPASRKARATTLAPRSCPSRPGFATSTRTFRAPLSMDLGPNQTALKPQVVSPSEFSKAREPLAQRPELLRGGVVAGAAGRQGLSALIEVLTGDTRDLV